MYLSVADAAAALGRSCAPECQRPWEFVFVCLALFHSIYSIFEMLGFHSSSQRRRWGGILEMSLIRGVSRSAEAVCSVSGAARGRGSPVPATTVAAAPVFAGTFLNAKVVVEATGRQCRFASILSVLGKSVKCRILGSG